MRISVAMATFNGEKFIKEQIISILNQLNENDELVISDDKSTDLTREIIADFIKNDNRIKLIDGRCKGISQNFENAIINCSNEYIFLSDQDDIWDNNKVSAILSTFEKSNCDLILHNARIFTEDNDYSTATFFQKRGCRKGIFNNIIKNSYIGCCMAFKADMKNYFLPFPKKIPMHDQWIGLICEKYGKVQFIDTPLILYRRHSNNASSDTPSSILTRIKWRFNIIFNLITITLKVNKGDK